MKNKKVLLVNTFDSQDGASRATYRLMQALIKNGVDVSLLAQSKKSDDFRIIPSANKEQKIQKFFNSCNPFFESIPARFYKNKDSLFSSSLFGFSNAIDKINKLNPDIVHLNWINRGMLKIDDIAKIKAPIVWSLHDNWAFSGGCHIMYDCQKYKSHCFACERLGSSTKKDLSYKVFDKKNKAFGQKDMFIVSVSKWLGECAKSSKLLKDKKHFVINNTLDTNIYKPLDKNIARELWGLPSKPRLILFGACDSTSNKNKGFKLLCESLKKLKRDDIELVVFGASEPKDKIDFGFKTHYMGHLYDDVSLASLYSSCDVMITPSYQEAFGQSASEALSCGTPTVAFKTTGLLDIIEHKKNGYLAKAFCSDDLANGINFVLDLKPKQYKQMCDIARKSVCERFSQDIIANKYIKVYKQILKLKTSK